MADRTLIVLALMLAITAGPAGAAPSPHPPMRERDGAGESALPMRVALGGRGEVPSLALVLGAGPDRKVAGLDAAAFGWAPAARSGETDMRYLAIVLSALALSWLGPARRQAAYRWIVRR